MVVRTIKFYEFILASVSRAFFTNVYIHAFLRIIMLGKRSELSISIIVAAVIGLIILVVIIAILTGRFNVYSSGVEELTTCKSTCDTLGMKSTTSFNKADCKGGTFGADRQILPGKFSDVTDPNKV